MAEPVSWKWEVLLKSNADATAGGALHPWVSLGAVGVHPLFEADSIRRAFERIERDGLTGPDLEVAHASLRQLGQRRTVARKLVLLDDMAPRALDVLIFFYFRSVDEFIAARAPVLH